MAYRKSPLLVTAVSLIALSTVTGCAQTGNPFAFGSTPAHEESGNANYQAAMRVADDSRSRGDLNTAISFYSRAAQFEPRMTQPLIELGDVFWQQKNPSESAKALEAARRIEAENDIVLRNLGRAYVALGQAKKAQEAYLAALAIDPNNARTLNGLGVAYDLDGDHATAQSHYKAGLALVPGNTDIKNNLAYSLISDRQYAEAVEILQPLVDGPAATARQRQNLALAYGLMGKEDQARRIARADLSPAEIERNLKVYRQLRNQPDHGQAIANIGKPGFTPPTSANTMAVAPSAVSENVMAPPEAEIVGVPEGAVLIKPPAPPKPEPAQEPKPAASPSVAAPAPAMNRPQPTDMVATTPVQAAPALPAPTQSGLGSGKIYLGRFANEGAAREAWIRIWTSNSTTLSSLVASIEPSDGQMALFAVGSSSAAQAEQTCLKLRQNGVSCGASN